MGLSNFLELSRHSWESGGDQGSQSLQDGGPERRDLYGERTSEICRSLSIHLNNYQHRLLREHSEDKGSTI